MKSTASWLTCIVLSCVLLDCATAAETVPTVTVQNCGMPGANTREALARLPRVLAGKPHHLVIFLGANDALNSSKLVGVKDYKKNLLAMIASAKKANVKSVLLLTLHPVIPEYLRERHPKHPQRQCLQEQLDQYNDAIRESAKETVAILVDWRARFLAESPGGSVEKAVENREDCLLRCVANCGARDGIHLTPNGYRLLADQLAGVLRDRVNAGETVVCFGDSLTYGSHVEGQGTATGKTYPAFLHAALSLDDDGGSEKLRGRQSGRPANMAAPGWKLTIRLPDGTFQQFSSFDQNLRSSVKSSECADETHALWNGLGAGAAAKMTVRMIRSERAAGAAWRLHVENRGDAALWEVTFPDFKAGVFEDDMVVIPSVSGRLHSVREPLVYRSEGVGKYPSGRLTMQCTGVYGKNGGIYLGVHDPIASTKRLEMICENGTLDIRWHWPVPNMGTPGTGWEMPGEVMIRPFEGDWFDIAQIYRDWASRKAGWWPRGKQAGRPDTPEWFKDNAVWVQIGGPWPRNRPPLDQNLVVPRVKRFAEFMGDIPCAVHWYNWHQVTFDNDYPHYFPAEEPFAPGIRELHAAGIRVMPYLNAHVWDTDLADFKTTAYPAAVKSCDGSMPTKSYAGNTFACMCPATPLWQQTVKGLVQKLASSDYGVDGVYLDQVAAQAAMLCFDKAHGHPLGGGGWWTTQGYWPMLDRIRASSPGTVLTSESSAEPYVNRLDGYLTWVGYRDGNSAIPLFHAVYAGQVQLFGRLYKWDSWKGVAMRAKTAQALVWGEQIGWIRPEVLDDPVAAQFLKRQARLRYALRRYLSSGRMARPPKIRTDGATLTANWVFTGDLMVTTPAVFSGAWLREDGKAVALILVNADDRPHSVTLPFDASAYDLKGDLAKCSTMVFCGRHAPDGASVFSQG
jgi:lysophospholipase L1-like esterase